MEETVNGERIYDCFFRISCAFIRYPTPCHRLYSTFVILEAVSLKHVSPYLSSSSSPVTQQAPRYSALISFVSNINLFALRVIRL